jgi:hypothetical protein
MNVVLVHPAHGPVAATKPLEQPGHLRASGLGNRQRGEQPHQPAAGGTSARRPPRR